MSTASGTSIAATVSSTPHWDHTSSMAATLGRDHRPCGTVGAERWEPVTRRGESGSEPGGRVPCGLLVRRLSFGMFARDLPRPDGPQGDNHSRTATECTRNSSDRQGNY